jgi:ectoine hydroxylase-related dioxygenase (phytanoyl-CoA dioxygenase family)
MDGDWVLTPEQVEFFRTFGYLHLRGLFADDISALTDAFDEVFEKEEISLEPRVELHNNDRRRIIFSILSKHPRLNVLLDDPRMKGVVSPLLGDDYEFAESDGSLFDCETHWHADTYGAPMTHHHVKVSFYLDPLRGDSGAIRVIPGSNDFESEFSRTLRRTFNTPDQIETQFGVDPRDIPSVTLDSDPGDVIVWDFRLVHASYNGHEGRRLFSVNFREGEHALAASDA